MSKLVLYCSWNVMAHDDAQEGNWRGNLANAVGSQDSSHYLGTWCIQHYYRWCRTPRLPVVDWTGAHRPIKMDWRMQWVASTLHTTSEHGVSSITTADVHNSAVSSRLNWRTPEDLNGLANAVGSQYPSHYLRTWCMQHYYRWCAHFGCQ